MKHKIYDERIGKKQSVRKVSFLRMSITETDGSKLSSVRKEKD